MTCEEGPQSAAKAAKVVVSLVHGTWASNTPWVQDDSLLRSRLIHRLGPIDFRCIKWPGSNSHTHRIEGAEKLRECLSECDATRETKHFIIGHSHGGMVALYALQDEALRERVSGVICLATPFLCIRERKLSRKLFFPMLLGLGGMLFLLVKPTEFFAVQSLVWIELFCIVLCFLMLLVSYWTGRDDSFGFNEFWKTRAVDRTGLVARLRIPKLDPESLLVVRPSGDEASGVLISSQLLSWMLARAWNVMDRVYETFDRLRQTLTRWLGAVLVLTLVLAAVFGLSGLGTETWRSAFVDKFYGVSVLFMVVVGLAILAVGLIAWGLTTALIVSQSLFGFDAILLGFDLQTTAEASPPGLAQVLHVSFPAPKLRESNELEHSRIYDDVGAVNQIVSWVESRLDQARPEAAMGTPPILHDDLT